MKKRVLSLLLCLSIVNFNGGILQKNVKGEENTQNYVEIDENITIQDVSDEVKDDIQAIVISDNIENQDVRQLNEVMDNGTGIIVDNMNISDVQEYFGADGTSEYENEIGCYVYKDGEDVNVIPIEASIVVDENLKENVTDSDYRKLKNKVEIDYEQVIEDYSNLSNAEKISNVEKEALPALQGSTDIGSAFVDSNKFVYFYKKGDCGGTGKTYKYSRKSKLDSWSVMGTLSFSIYAIKVKTAGNKTYDNVFAVTITTPCEGKAVAKYYNGISFNEDKKCSIIDYTEPDGNADESVSGSIGTGIDSNGGVTNTYTISYSYNPGGMLITPKLYKNRVRWICDPMSDRKWNKSWKINPGILLKKSNGKSSEVTVTSYVSYFQIFGGVRTYTIEKTVSCSIKFKNHKKV